MDKNRVLIFDTTLRDGEQSPGASLSVTDKIAIAHQLARLRVDIIEAGFPISSQAQFQATKAIAEDVEGPTVAALARCVDQDIERAGEALKNAKKPRIHTFVATSKIHLEKKFRKSENEILDMATRAVKKARNFVDDVEFSPEDSARTGKNFLFRIIEAAIDAGATTINVPDTVGYSNPEEYGGLIREIINTVPNMDKAILSVHCHNDLGLAVANTLAAVQNGAQQVEVTINGIGERAGNASLEEVVMALKTRQNYYGKTTGINTREIVHTSRMVSNLTGLLVQPNKAIVGMNAFAHEAGIHQDAMIKDSSTYEIMTPEEIGLDTSKIVLGRHSGRHGLNQRLQELGYSLKKEELDKVYDRFLEVADKKKEIFDEDLIAIVGDEYQEFEETYHLDYFHINSGNSLLPTATIVLKRDNEEYKDAAVGDGPIDAAYRAIEKIVNRPLKLAEYSLRGVTGGKDAMGEVVVRIQNNGNRFLGRGASTDVIEASIRAFVNALNRMIHLEKAGKVETEKGL